MELILCRITTLEEARAGEYEGGLRVRALRPVQPILRRFSLTINSSLCASTHPSGTATTFNAEGNDERFVTKILPLGVYSLY
jgi:hypothetical protein